MKLPVPWTLNQKRSDLKQGLQFYRDYILQLNFYTLLYQVVQEALDSVCKGRTVLVIAHRLSTVKNANLIAVISKGKIAEMGTHEELKRKGGIYSYLIRQQEVLGAGA